MFSLCFREGGGIFTLGGVDPKVQHVGSEMRFTEVVEASVYEKERLGEGFWTIKLEKVQFLAHDSSVHIPVFGENDMVHFDSGKGTIIDSGTSQSYFPKKPLV